MTAADANVFAQQIAYFQNWHVSWDFINTCLFYIWSLLALILLIKLFILSPFTASTLHKTFIAIISVYILFVLTWIESWIIV
jgi:hypothetical protein